MLFRLSLNLVSSFNFLQTIFIDQINHSPSITTEDYACEIKGAGIFSRDLLFSLQSPVSVKAGELVMMSNFMFFRFYYSDNHASKIIWEAFFAYSYPPIPIV